MRTALKNSSISSLKTESICSHCKQFIPVNVSISLGNESFCCSGCKFVFQIINNNHLSNYYKLKENQKTNSLQDHNFQKNFSFLKTESYKFEYLIKEKDSYRGNFYVNGISCHACLWLIEKSKDYFPDIKNLKVRMGENSISVVSEDKNIFFEIAVFLNQFGYILNPYRNSIELRELKAKENNKEVLRLGVSGFLAMNIMFFSFSLYSGANQFYQVFFSYGMALLYLPIFVYGSWPFFNNAIIKLKVLKPTIDQPLSFAIILGTILSYINILTGDDNHYFDTLSVLIFLILFSRYLLKQVSNLSSKANEVVPDWFQQTIIDVSKNEEILLSHIENEKIYQINRENILPVKAKILEESLWDTSMINGEFEPKLIQSGEIVEAGFKLLSKEVCFVAKESYSESYLFRFFSTLRECWGTRLEESERADIIAIRVVAFSFIISLGLIISFFALGDINEGINRALGVLIITCPCALGIGIPLTYSKALGNLLKVGILVKNPIVLRDLHLVKKIFFDKTGTLTTGKFKVTKWDGEKSFEVLKIIYQIESYSSHPIARAIQEFIDQTFTNEFQEEHISGLKLTPRWLRVKERLGEGLIANHKGDIWTIKKSEYNPNQENQEDSKTIVVMKNDQVVCEIQLQDEIRVSSRVLIEDLKKLNYSIGVLSGDHQENVNRVIEDLKFEDVKKLNVLGDLNPEAKEKIVDNAIMVGDGFNDILAMKKASAAFALGGRLDLLSGENLIMIKDSDISKVLTTLLISQNLNINLRRNILFSLAFNILGITGAVFGLISPLVAAVLMPISSIIVVFISVNNMDLKKRKF